MKNKVSIDRITALWAFSEAALGGILHALKIPFTGLFIGGSAVIFISLLAYYSDSRKVIFESTLKVILVKFVVSPYSPIAAYFAVLLQSVLGTLLFFWGFKKISAILLGFLSLLLSAFQKIFILTIIFGMTLWESIEVFIDFVLTNFLPNQINIESFNFTYYLVGAYILSHVFGGLFAGWYASILPDKINNHSLPNMDSDNTSVNDVIPKPARKKRKKWWRKSSNILIFILSIALILISFQFDDVDQSIATKVMLMVLRSVVIISVWYYFISPILLKIVNKILLKRRLNQAKDIENIVDVFPNIKSLIKNSWVKVKERNGAKKYIMFLDFILIGFLLEETENEN